MMIADNHTNNVKQTRIECRIWMDKPIVMIITDLERWQYQLSIHYLNVKIGNSISELHPNWMNIPNIDDKVEMKQQCVL